MIDRRSPSEKLLSHDASAIESAAGGPIDLAIILGSGLSSALRDAFAHTAIPYDKLLGFPVASLAGHAGEALVGTWHGKRIAAFAGRVHLYQGFSPQQVTVGVRLAQAAGANTLILTNAAGALNADYASGDLMLIRDHINLTGRSPLIGVGGEQAFTNMVDAYSPRLRNLAMSCAARDAALHEGVYVGLQGPNFETPAEAQYLRTIGGDAVGMSTVLETILARSLGLGVLGISAITNYAGRAQTTHADVTA
ncbi:MAG TPA: purine-nucleoside phosphorylase, partial [Candidatus Dormibacteraeota bacterium]|nr:purine-nucleoside phosphorylase [Candidatus Dormibacteraeota bacterium]